MLLQHKINSPWSTTDCSGAKKVEYAAFVEFKSTLRRRMFHEMSLICLPRHHDAFCFQASFRIIVLKTHNWRKNKQMITKRNW